MMCRADAYLDAMLRHRGAVQDVMTTPVVSADMLTPFQEIARLLAEHRISGLPVLTEGGRVVGVVSEADLLAAEERVTQDARQRRRPHPRLTALELMTAPAITIGPEAAIPAAVHLMNARQVRRLPVTSPEDFLIGIVTGHDLLRAFLRRDADVAREVRFVLDELPLTDPASIIATVRHGIVTLGGTIRPRPGQGRPVAPLAIRRVQDVQGVVDVHSWLIEAGAAKSPGPLSPRSAFHRRRT